MTIWIQSKLVEIRFHNSHTQLIQFFSQIPLCYEANYYSIVSRSLPMPLVPSKLFVDISGFPPFIT